MELQGVPVGQPRLPNASLSAAARADLEKKLAELAVI
jgi:dihydrodipicolinate synthase/N-acetylneuraminate lyase